MLQSANCSKNGSLRRTPPWRNARRGGRANRSAVVRFERIADALVRMRPAAAELSRELFGRMRDDGSELAYPLVGEACRRAGKGDRPERPPRVAESVAL